MPQGCRQLGDHRKFLQAEPRSELQEREGPRKQGQSHGGAAEGGRRAPDGDELNLRAWPPGYSEWELGDPAVLPVAITGGLHLLVFVKVWTRRGTLERRPALNGRGAGLTLSPSPVGAWKVRTDLRQAGRGETREHLDAECDCPLNLNL